MQGPYSADEGLVEMKRLVISGGLTVFLFAWALTVWAVG